MKMRPGFLATCAASGLVIGMAVASPAVAADMVTKAPAAEPLAWWYTGFAEFGYRFDINKPDKSSLGKFYEYRDLRPGPYGNFLFGAHRTGSDPLDIVAWGENVGWNDQAYGVDIAKPGSYYLTGQWDETQHVYWRDAQTMYNGVGTNNLTITNFLTSPLTVANAPANNAKILANSQTIDLKIRRDTASAAARWTPTDNWDINADYSHMHREGVQALGAVSFSGPTATRSAFEIPKPVDDTTQIANLKGEYAGSTPWGKRFNVAVGGGFSSYQNSFDSVTFQNPWNAVNTATSPTNNRYSLAPNNQAGTVNLQGGVGLPWNSRYMGTLQYSKMTSDQSSLPISINPFVTALAGVNLSTPDRETSTLLSNNVLNTQIASNLQSTLKYRYYSYNTADAAALAQHYPPNPDSTSGFPDDESKARYASSYVKQNADAQIDYRPWKWLNVGASYDWEHWSRAYRETSVTNENTGKIFADSKWGFSTIRASLQYGQRRYDTYTALPTDSNIPGYRMQDLANRDRTKGMASWAVEVTNMLTITPNAGFTYDDYKTNVVFTAPGGEIGLKQAKSWYAGADATLNISRGLSFYLAYNYDRQYRQVYENAAIPLANVETTDGTHMFMVGSKFTAIPDKLFIDANYTYTMAQSQWNLSCTPGGCQYPGLAVFPNIHNNLSHLDVQAKYMLDPTFMRSAGFFANAKSYLKARLMWERNTNDSWQSLQNQFGFLVNPTVSTTGYSIWMATGNPNYNVILGQVSFGVTW